MWSWSTDAGRAGIQPVLTSPGSLQLVPVTRIEKKFVTNGAVSAHEEKEMSQTLVDDSEVVFDQPEESAGAMEPEGSVPNRRKEEAWLEDTEPYRGARPRTMEFDRPVDGGLGATLGGVEDKDKLRDGVVPELRPEQQIQHKEEVQTPPQREPRWNEGHQINIYKIIRTHLFVVHVTILTYEIAFMANLNQHINGSGSDVVTYISNFTIQMAVIFIMNSSVSSFIHMQIVKTIV